MLLMGVTANGDLCFERVFDEVRAFYKRKEENRTSRDGYSGVSRKKKN